MARKSTRNAQGAGTLRQRPDGRWEARYTVGRDPGTGKQIQRSIYGATQQEVRKKLAQVTTEIDSGTYKEPCKMTLSQWLDIWSSEYLGGVKPKTVESYCCQIKNHINPGLGAVKLEGLNTHTIQKFYNGLGKGKDGKTGLSPKSIKIVHGVLHKALQQAVSVKYIKFNPSDACTVPRVEKKEIKPLGNEAITNFLKAIQGHRFEDVYLTLLFTGMRRGEICGLTWDHVNLEKGTILINRQLQNIPGQPGVFQLVSTKSSKGRTITIAAALVEVLKKHRAKQAETRLLAGPLWKDEGFVFTNDTGGYLSPNTLYHNYKRIVASIGLPDARLHDLRHSFAVVSLRSGDDVKTVQTNLGHHSAAFTLDTYGHVIEEMKKDSADRMNSFIKSISNL